MVELKKGPTKTILVIDDDEDILNLFKLKLKKLKEYQVVTANDSYVGYGMARNQKFNFIITAWKMPKFNGIDLIAGLRRTNFNGSTPIILMTASIEEIQEEVEDLEDLQMIAKPVKWQDVFDAIDFALNKKKKKSMVIDSVFLDNVVSSFENILEDMGKFKDIQKAETIMKKKDFQYKYDYFGTFFIRSDAFNGLFTLGFPRDTFLNFASQVVEGDKSKVDQNLDEMLDLFMNIFLAKTKKDMVEKNIGLKEIHGITVVGRDERVSSQDAKVEFYTKFESSNGPFFIQITIW